MKILFTGYGRAGKDEAASLVSKITGLRYAGSFSWAALPYVAARLGLHPQVAWETRHNMRQIWYDYCNDLRAADPTILARMVLQQGDITAGLRDGEELRACKAAKLFDEIVWIHRPGTPVDPTVTFGPGDCDSIITNRGTLADYHNELRARCEFQYKLPIIA
ncbi:MAG: hypothetical protein HOO67_05555 [Candidatus Peribacteraceae bacterium]|nr:hypothetical protein [Candidatus Peribacteraceae bacterium]